MLATFRVLVIGGARQVGKSTLASAQLDVQADHVFSLDDPAILSRAVDDPTGFAAAVPHGSVIDEFQRAGQPLLLAVKRIVDTRSVKGQFILTGSANYLAARGATETLAGRAGRLQLWPLSIGERLGSHESFLDQIFDDDRHWKAAAAENDREKIMAWILEGGFPEVVRDQLTPRRRARWFDAYTDDVVNREALRPIAEVRHEHELRRLLRALAARIGTQSWWSPTSPAISASTGRRSPTTSRSSRPSICSTCCRPSRPAPPPQQSGDPGSTSSTRVWPRTSTASANEISPRRAPIGCSARWSSSSSSPKY